MQSKMVLIAVLLWLNLNYPVQDSTEHCTGTLTSYRMTKIRRDTRFGHSENENVALKHRSEVVKINIGVSNDLNPKSTINF